MMDLVLKNATVVTGQGRYRADIGVEGERIAAITAPQQLSGRTTLDCGGLFVLPGAIDAHVHFRDPGFTYKEDCATGSQAAAAGGVTMVIDMPNTDPPVASAGVVASKAQVYKGRAFVDFGFYALITPENLGEVPALVEAGVAGFKGYMSLSASGMPLLGDGALLEALDVVTRHGSLLTLHAENQPMLDAARRRLQAQGRVDYAAHPEARPALAEEEAVRRATFCAAAVGGRLHIAHLTTHGGTSAVREARRQGAPVTAETSPFHLLMSTEDAARLGPLGVNNPPLRSPADVRGLWEGIRDGSIDIVATDHSPHSREEKVRDSVWEVKSGTVSVQTMVPLLLTQVSAGRLRLEDVARLSSERVADVFGLAPRKGRIQIGSDADLTVVDMARRVTVSAEWLLNRSRHTPFEGCNLTGLPAYTIVRGQVVMADGRIVGQPAGQFVKPERPHDRPRP